MASTRADKQTLGTVGVYLLAMEFSRRGLVAVPTIRNVRGTDLLVANSEGTKAVTVQVKTRRGSDFPVGSFVEAPADYAEGTRWLEKAVSPSPMKVYGFVEVDDDDRPKDFWIVPSEVVLDQLRELRDEYVGGPYSDKPTRMATRGPNVGQPVQDKGPQLFYPEDEHKGQLGLDLVEGLLID